MIRRGLLFGLAAALAFGLGACDSGPSGPGTVQARVTGGETPAGAAVVEVTGKGIRGFEAAGGTRVYSGALSEGSNVYRVVLVNGADAGELRFGIRVDDRGAELPSAAVVIAADTANRPIGTPADLAVHIER